MAVFHGPHKLAGHGPDGSLIAALHGAGDNRRARTGMAR